MTSLRLALGLALAFAGSTAAPPGEADTRIPPAPFEDCRLNTPGTPLSAQAECSTLEVPENRSQAGGRRISLRIARVPARRSKDRAPDPLYLFAGGPGQAATEIWPALVGTLERVNRYREVILVDQRGTGGSNRLDCPYPDVAVGEEPSREEVLAGLEACLDGLDADPAHYSTTDAVEDIEAVREALGHNEINLLGISYGTRAAQVYLRRYPERVRSLVLDGVVPPGVLLGTEHAPMLDRALAALFERCRAEESCLAAHGDPAEQLRQLQLQVKTEAPVVTLRHPRTAEAEAVTVSRLVLATAVRLLSYTGETQALLPLVIAEARRGHWTPLLAQALAESDSLEEQLARGMELSVVCSEDVPFYPDTVDSSNTLLGDDMVRLLRAECATWPSKPVAPDFHAPGSWDTPALLLSGEFDPVTPPSYGERALEQFPNGIHRVVPGQGHNVLGRGCLPRLIARFLATADPASARDSCVEALPPPPFFVDPLGPAP